MAGETGLEPATSTVTGWHSNQLSYSPACGNMSLIYTLLLKMQVQKTKKREKKINILSEICIRVPLLIVFLEI